MCAPILVRLPCLVESALIGIIILGQLNAVFTSQSSTSDNRQHSDVLVTNGNDRFNGLSDAELVPSAGALPEEVNLSDSSMEDEDNEREEEISSKLADQFSWRHHRDDHSIYTGRSLISSPGCTPKPSGSELDESELGSMGGPVAEIDEEEARMNPLRTSDYAEKEWQLMFRSFDTATDNLGSSLLSELGKQTNLFEDIVGRLKPECQRSIRYIRDSARKHKLWALRMLDSNGKLPSGITYGRFSSPGDYEECLTVQVNDELLVDAERNLTERHTFHGKYCLLDFRLPMPERPSDKLLSIHESLLDFSNTELGKMFPDMLGNYSAYASVFYEVGYLHAFCLPSTCDVADLARSMSRALEGTYLIVNNTVDCEQRPPGQRSPPMRTSQLIALFLMLVLFLNAALASYAHYIINHSTHRLSASKTQGRQQASVLMCTNKLWNGPVPDLAVRRRRCPPNGDHPSEGPERSAQGTHEAPHLCCNSRKQNRRLAAAWLQEKLPIFRSDFYSDCFSIQSNFARLTKPDPRGLTFVHYTRIVAMALTVITHTGALGTLQAVTKPADASNSEQIFRDFIPQMLANAFTSIQIFFFMAGFMLVISTYPSIVRDKGHISFLEYATKRAIRLMPGIAATICVNFLWPLVVDGPMLTYFIRMIVEPCERNWWHTLGFISNFDHVEKMCLRHSYFSASDYQLHIIAFPLLILLYRQPQLALGLAGLLTLAGFVAQVIMILTKTVLPFMMVDYIDKQAFFNVIHYIHHPVWNHMSAFFYGFIIGYLVVRQVRVDLSPRTIQRLWWILLPAGLASIFAPYFWNHYKRPIYKWQMVLYVIFDRFILLTTCAWLSYATMVLARKPTPKRAAKEATDSVTRVAEAAVTGSKPMITIQLEGPAQKPAGMGAASGPDTPTLPRQRSSPNLGGYPMAINQQAEQQQQQQQPAESSVAPPVQRPLSRTISNSNLATIIEPPDTQIPPQGPKQTATTTPELPQQHQHRRPRPPVSNINTLCLVLSRLTFQLYLFNMVVLWVDVNHSKYYWFFSYYFIVFKAAAVYICSAFMAMIFFIVLESPCLTLYIAWVRKRAGAQAKRRAAAAGSGRSAPLPASKQPPSVGSLNKLTQVAMSSCASPAAQQRRQSISGRPLSFIDLPPSAPTNINAKGGDGSVDQTRM